MISRRALLKKTPLVLSYAVGISALAGCPKIGDVLAVLETYVPVGLQAFTGIVTLINPPVGTGLALAVIAAKAGWADVSAAIAFYQSAPAAAKSTALGKVDTALEGLVGGLQKVLNSFGLSSQTDQQAAVAALMLLIATLSGIQAGITPAGVTTAARARRAAIPARMVVGAQSVEISSTADPKKFKAQYNAIMNAGGHPQLQLQ